MILIFAILFTLCACVQTQAEVVSGYLKAGSFAYVYDVDEILDLEKAVLVVRFSDGTTEERKIEDSFVDGFDTSTTGQKTLTVTYGEKISLTWDYEVLYSADPTKEIKTTARASSETTFYEGGCSLEITLNKGNLEGIAAMSFTISYADSAVVPTIVIASGWDYGIYSYGAGQWGAVVYAPDGNTEEKLVFNVVGQGAAEPPHIGTVKVSDGKSDYDLPDAGGNDNA